MSKELNMKCSEVKRLLPAWLDRELKSDRREDVARHLAACVVCRAEMAALQADRRSLVASRVPQPSPFLLMRVMAEVRRSRTSRRWWPVPALRAAAAAVVFVASLGVGIMVGRGLAGAGNTADSVWSAGYTEPVVVDVYEPALGGD